MTGKIFMVFNKKKKHTREREAALSEILITTICKDIKTGFRDFAAIKDE
jgi:hypothetical protein